MQRIGPSIDDVDRRVVGTPPKYTAIPHPVTLLSPLPGCSRLGPARDAALPQRLRHVSQLDQVT